MFPNRMTLVAFIGQEPKTFATLAEEITRLSVAAQTLSTKLGMEREGAMAQLRPLRQRCSVRSQSPEGKPRLRGRKLSYRDYTRTIYFTELTSSRTS